MRLLIDTTSNHINVGLADQEGLRDLIVEDVTGRHSEQILSLIDQALGKEEMKLSDIKEGLVIAGPGGFTSLRVGIATANALAFAQGFPLKSIDYLSWQQLVCRSKQSELDEGAIPIVPAGGEYIWAKVSQKDGDVYYNRTMSDFLDNISPKSTILAEYSRFTPDSLKILKSANLKKCNLDKTKKSDWWNILCQATDSEEWPILSQIKPFYIQKPLITKPADK